MRFKLLFATISFLLFSTAVFSQVDERGLKKKADTASSVIGNTYALIIGISNYKNVQDLQFADKDAEAFEKFLLSSAGGNIPKTNIETFLNENANRTNAGDAISIIARKAKQGDRVYFFFAGHGDMEDLTQIENGLLLLYNSPNGNYFGMNDDVLEILDLKRYLSPLAQRGVEMIFIVDACHSGNLKGGVEGVQQTASALTAAWGKEYKILSCQPNQLSLESSEWGGGRGLFSLQLEEGMKGLADMDNNGVINMFELQSYIQANVAKYSEGKQIPLVSGDLSKPIVKVNPQILAALRIEKAKNYPMLATANTKGNNDKYFDSLTTDGKKIYLSFIKNMEDKKLIWPKDTNALKDYRLFEKNFKNNLLLPAMRRNLAASLSDRFNTIASPLLKGETSYSTRDECYYAAMELDSCLRLLGKHHYMYSNLKARKLYMDAMTLTWALSETEYNISLKPTLLKSIQLLEQSAQLEPNAAYTLSALGINYTYIYEYEKANIAFQKFLTLRPNDLYAKYTLGTIYARLKQYDKAENLFEAILKERPDIIEIKGQLLEIYQGNGNFEKALSLLDQMMIMEKDKTNTYFYRGIYYSKLNNPDSAIYYYNAARKLSAEYFPIFDNNIGHIYFINNQTDSAKKYFRMILAKDSTEPFANFNLATIEVKERDMGSASLRFIKTITYATPFTDGFVTHLPLYFGKTYTAADEKELNNFSKISFTFNMQYLAYLSILYAYIRIPDMINKTENIKELFTALLNYKQHEVFTWYHHACYKALKKDKKGALESIEKALKLGFGNLFMLTHDDDLKSIRYTPEYKLLMATYFPDTNKGH